MFIGAGKLLIAFCYLVSYLVRWKACMGRGKLERGKVGTILADALLCANHGHLINYIINNVPTSIFVYVCMFV